MAKTLSAERHNWYTASKCQPHFVGTIDSRPVKAMERDHPATMEHLEVVDPIAPVENAFSRITMILALVLSIFLVSLDMTIIATAVSSLSRSDIPGG